ncbi:ParB/RepB/Spo0J family partition protein [Streptomyces sp. NPDC002547]
MALQPAKPGRRTKKGRGTSTSNPENTGIYDVPDGDWDLLDVPLTQIVANPFNDRDMGDLEELANDIRNTGLLEPVSIMSTELFLKEYGERFPEACAEVKEKGTKYVLGYGERRWRASEMAGEPTIKAIVRNDLVPTIRLDLIKENYHRKDPTELEQARHISRLVTEDSLSYREVAEALSIKSIGTITKRLRLLELPIPAQQAIEEKAIGVTAALELLELDDEAQRLGALSLMVDQRMRAKDAVYHVRVNGVSQGNGDAESDSEAPSDAGQPEVPAQRETNSESGGTSDPEVQEDGDGSSAEANGEVAPEAETVPARKMPPAPVTRKKATPATGTGSDRYTANKERELACVELLREKVEIPAEARDALIRRALLATKGDARGQAHVWLVQANRAHFDIRDTDGYFQAVLSSDDAELITLATTVTALAANEARASDRRRPTWDRHDAEYVRFLIQTAGYVPATQWEKTELARLGVSLENTNDPEHPDQESL